MSTTTDQIVKEMENPVGIRGTSGLWVAAVTAAICAFVVGSMLGNDGRGDNAQGVALALAAFLLVFMICGVHRLYEAANTLLIISAKLRR